MNVADRGRRNEVDFLVNGKRGGRQNSVQRQFHFKEYSLGIPWENARDDWALNSASITGKERECES
jgi:hypothetical protein